MTKKNRRRNIVNEWIYGLFSSALDAILNEWFSPSKRSFFDEGILTTVLLRMSLYGQNIPLFHFTHWECLVSQKNTIIHDADSFAIIASIRQDDRPLINTKTSHTSSLSFTTFNQCFTIFNLVSFFICAMV